MKVPLPVVPEQASSLKTDGHRNFVHPADVSGRFTRLRYAVFAGLLAIYIALPFIEVGGRPAVFLDVVNRRFFLFGASFNAQDFWLAFFLLTGVGFALIVLTTVLGRVWCGYMCPQTVFLEAIFRRVERLVEGPRSKRLERNAAPFSLSKLARKVLKHALFLLAATLLAHVFLSYFVSLPSMMAMAFGPPSDHPEAFGWVAAMTGVLYLNFSWFREQLCMIVCPYGRLQSVLTDDDTLVIGYDGIRGEPRGKAKDPNAGDCVDCKRCVVVCPTGIDIRNGLQLECIGCAACVDACDTIMGKLGRDPGLVRYDSLRGLEGGKRVWWRSRLLLYIVLGIAGLLASTLALSRHVALEANLLRPGGATFAVEGGVIRNPLSVHLVNKADEPRVVRLTASAGPDATFVLPMPEVQLPALADQNVPLLLTLPVDDFQRGMQVTVTVELVDTDETHLLSAPILGPSR